MSKEIVPLTQDDRKLLTEIAGAMGRYEGEIAQRWDELFVQHREGLRESDRAIKDFKEAVWLLLTSLSDGDFDAYFKRIDEKGADFAKTKEQYENLIMLFHLYEEATSPFLRSSFGDRINEVLSTLDHMYHNVIAILARAYFRGLEKEREKFVSLLAHDLKNPLTSIIGFSELMIERNRAGTLAKEKEEAYLNMIMDSGARMLQLIDGALNYGKLKSGKFRLTLSFFDVVQVAWEASSFSLTDAEKAGISILINGHEVREDLRDMSPVTIMADMDLTLRAVGNYISNAIKYAKSRVNLSIREKDDDILITVEDDGPGIPKNEINNIFEDYYMAQGGKPGTGLGLPSVRMIAALHGGAAWAEFEEGKGSVFYLRLPKKQEV